jgi:UTP--glucose-1-phosphate uridylyltransferase
MRQQYMLGTGNALMLVEPFVAKEPFVVAYPDDVIFDTPPLSRQLIDAYQQTGDTILAVQEVAGEDVSRYGVIDPQGDGPLLKVRRMVEKPAPGTEPSRFVSYGRYLYTPEIFEILRETLRSHTRQGEFTQTEALDELAKRGRVSAVHFQGERFDVGEPLAYAQTSIKLALRRQEFRQPLLEYLRKLLEEEETRRQNGDSTSQSASPKATHGK